MMEQEQIMQLCEKTSNEKYIKYLRDVGWKFEDEQSALDGYARMVKAEQGTPLAWAEFFSELGIENETPAAQALYHTLLGLVEKGALSAYGLYLYAKFRWCVKHPEAVIACQIGPKRWAVNACPEIIGTERAVLLINSSFGFEASRIKLLDAPYYNATDWNFVHFRCGDYDWVMQNGELHQIYQ